MPIQILFLGVAATYAGRLDEACDHFERLAEVQASGIPGVSAALRALCRRETGAARKILENQAFRDLARLDKEFSWWLASAFSFAGYADETLHWLANAIDLGFVNHHLFMKIDPYLARLRCDSRFEALMERAREKQRAFEI